LEGNRYHFSIILVSLGIISFRTCFDSKTFIKFLSSQTVSFAKVILEHYALAAEKKPFFPKVFGFFEKWTFINVQKSKVFLLLNREK
jgi:hypothetical protein